MKILILYIRLFFIQMRFTKKPQFKKLVIVFLSTIFLKALSLLRLLARKVLLKNTYFLNCGKEDFSLLRIINIWAIANQDISTEFASSWAHDFDWFEEYKNVLRKEHPFFSVFSYLWLFFFVYGFLYLIINAGVYIHPTGALQWSWISHSSVEFGTLSYGAFWLLVCYILIQFNDGLILDSLLLWNVKWSISSFFLNLSILKFVFEDFSNSISFKPSPLPEFLDEEKENDLLFMTQELGDTEAVFKVKRIFKDYSFLVLFFWLFFLYLHGQDRILKDKSVRIQTSLDRYSLIRIKFDLLSDNRSSIHSFIQTPQQVISQFVYKKNCSYSYKIFARLEKNNLAKIL